ncbi:MAG TPA: phytanoyl-CoA dioxygenase family protein [Steroidobacteraceae bacterium]|nr:phytanoyl-CoA dioxygenase family protein [Steroidobacteraceae bacterium]
MSDLSSGSRARWYRRPDGSALRDLPRPAQRVDWRSRVTPQMRTDYARNGVLFIPQIIEPQWLALAEQAIRRNFLNPGPHSVLIGEGDPGAWFMDHGNFDVNPEFQYLLYRSPIADIMMYLLDTREIWLFHEQVFIKQGGNNTITYWHQDLPYWIVQGTQLGSLWLTLDPVPKKFCLEFVPGSHLGTQYAGSTFNPADPTEPVYPTLPRIPDIQQERSKWNIVSWDVTPGDVIIIHPGVLHGGGGTGPGSQRRTVSFRMFGDDATLNGRFEREGQHEEPPYPALDLQPDQPMRDPRFVKLRSQVGPLPAMARRWIDQF